ncbi:hypothetical protein TNCV_447611 [Trichonephila clavipes]|nr:hypothetical protein TNCV_447611 [Trichonephila clavipes]
MLTTGSRPGSFGYGFLQTIRDAANRINDTYAPTRSAWTWVNEGVPSLLGNLTLEVSRQTVHLSGTSAHAPQRRSDEAHFWLNGYVNKQNCRIWSEANPQVYVETPLHPEKLTVWCALWACGILLQKR